MAKIINSFEEAESIGKEANIMIIIGIILIVAVVSSPIGFILLIIGLMDSEAAVIAKKKFDKNKKHEADIKNVAESLGKGFEAVGEGIASIFNKEPKETFVNCEHCSGKNSTKNTKCEHCGAHLKA